MACVGQVANLPYIFKSDHRFVVTTLVVAVQTCLRLSGLVPTGRAFDVALWNGYLPPLTNR